MISALKETYEIKLIIGKGGMSTVYLAEHKRLHTLWGRQGSYKESFFSRRLSCGIKNAQKA